MSGEIGARFEELQRRRGRALVPYLMSGFPTRSRFRKLLGVVVEEGADLIEVGVPFSDPLADGPVIQAAGHQALTAGTDLDRTLEDVAHLRGTAAVPVLLMSYLNPLRAYGLERCAQHSRRAGVGGWIVPDRDLERPEEVLEPAAAARLDVVPLVAPTTPQARMGRALQGAGGFVYLVSVTGVTGARRSLDLHLSAYARRVRRHTPLPRCVGFGIAGREQAAAAAREVEGVIVGSALLEPLLRKSWERGLKELSATLRAVRAGLSSRK